MLKEVFQTLTSSKSKTFFAFCFCFIIGAALFSFSNTNTFLFPLCIASFVISFLIIIFWSYKTACFVLFCSLFFILGGLRFLITIPHHQSDQISFYINKKIEFVGIVDEEPDIRIDKAYYVIKVKEVLEQNKSKRIKGKVLVAAPLYPEYVYGDELKIRCKFQHPQNDSSTFRYDKYLAARSISVVCNFLELEEVSSNNGNKFMSIILYGKSKVAYQIEKLWGEPHSSFIAGLLYGKKSGLPLELRENFNRTGITHIIAISGFNITIISVYLMNIFIYCGLYRQHAFWAVAFLIILFVIFTGASASVVRAAIMGITVLVTRRIGRVSHRGNVLLCTAALMTLFNPYIVIWDAGFQLSFLATIGLLYLSPIIQRSLSFSFFGKFGETFLENLQATLSAIIITMPLILYQFGNLSIVAPLVNMLILWLIPLLMLIGFLAVIIGSFIFPLGRFIAWITYIGLEYIIKIVEWFGSRSWSVIEFKLPWWGMGVCYVLLFAFIIRYNKSKLALYG